MGKGSDRADAGSVRSGSGHRLLLTRRSVPQPLGKAPHPCGRGEFSAIESFGQAVQVLGHAFEVLADLRALLGLPGALVAQVGDPHDLLIDVLGDMALLLRGRCHLLAHASDTADRLDDTGQRLWTASTLCTLSREICSPRLAVVTARSAPERSEAMM